MSLPHGVAFPGHIHFLKVKYNVGLTTLLQQGIQESVFYGDLVYFFFRSKAVMLFFLLSHCLLLLPLFVELMFIYVYLVKSTHTYIYNSKLKHIAH